MALTVTEKPYVTDIEEGSYLAICTGIFDIGTIVDMQYGTKKEKVCFEFEIPELKDREGFPRTLTLDLTASLDNRAKLRKHLVSWRGKGLGVEESKNFSLKQLLGEPAMLLIVHSRGKGEKANNVYHNVETISGLPRGMPRPVPSRKLLYFDFADGKADIPYGIDDRIKAKIESSPEWKALKEGRPLKPAAPAANAAAPAARPGNQAPAEIVDILNEMGLAYPYTDEELDKVYQPDFGEATYEILKKHATPF